MDIVTINFIKRKTFKEILWKAANVIVGVTTILNLSMVGVLIAPKAAHAVTGSATITATLEPIEPSTGVADDKDGEPPTSGSADPSEFIVAAKINVAGGSLTNVAATLSRTNGSGGQDTVVDNDNPRNLGTLTAGTHWLYWSINKDQSAAKKNETEVYTLNVTSPDVSPFASPAFTATFDGSASISQNDMDFVDSFVTPSAGTIGSTFDVLTKYQQSSANALSQINSQLYHDGTKLRLVDVDAFYYNDTDPGSITGGVPAGATATFPNNPHITTIPGTSDNNDFWVFRYTLEIRAFGTSILAPYLQTLGQGDTWKVDSGYGSFVAAPSKLSGFKFNDLNGNGVWNDGEPTIPGVTINLSGDASDSTTTNGTGFYEFANLSPGDYTVAEIVPEGYTNTTPASVNVTLTPGEQEVVNFGNWVNRGTITFEKIVSGGSAVPGDWTFTIDGVPGTFHHGDSTTLTIGQYAVTESGPANYTATSVGGVCSNLNGLSATLTVTAQGGTCTFTNTRDVGSITVNKKVDTDGNGTFEGGNSEANTLGFRWSLDGAAANRIMGSSETVNTGSHGVNENSIAGYHFISWYYTNATDASCANPESTSLPASVAVTKDANTSITLCNARDTGDLKVIKHVVNDNGGNNLASDFTLHIKQNGGDVVSPFAGSESGSVYNLPTGTYAVSETGLPTGYAQSSIICDGLATSSVTVEAGGTKICTITNDDIQPKLTVTKRVINDNGGTEGVSDFSLFVDATPVVSGVQNGFNAGNHSVSETPVFGYDATIGGDCAPDGSITLNPGDIKSCTITNDDIAPQLTVIKHVINDNGGTKVAADFTMNVTATNVSDPSFPGSEGGITVTLNQGAYSVDETGPSGYAKSFSNNCTGTINVGEHKTCTITNDDIQPKLTVTKVVINDNGGTKQVADFALFVDLTPVTSGVQNGFNAGTYVVSETQQTGYTATITGDCAANGSITLNPGDVKSCTITNDDIQPRLIVKKIVNNSHGGTAVPSDFTMTVTGSNPNPASFPGDSNGTTVTLNAGSYSVSESGPSGYDPVFSPDCSGTISVGDTKTCIVTNNAIAPVLFVIKHVINDNGGTKVAADFTMNVTATNPSPATFPGSETGTAVTLDVGLYSVDETGPAGYVKSFSGACTGSIALGQTKFCTITNDDIAPELTIIKHVINDNGGTKVAADFTMNVTATNVSNPSFPGSEAGVTVTLNQGAYTVDETGPAGYTKSLSQDCSGTINVGEHKTCTITNDDIQPKLTVTKVVINDNGGTKQVADFALFVDLTPVTSGVQNGFNAGVYVVSEAFVTGYSATIGGECAPDGSITLNPGDVKSCTITNDDIQPKLTVTKVVINDDGGTKTVTDFPLFVDETSVVSGVQNGFNAGTYAVSEASQAGYTATIGGDCAANGSITLNPGDVKSCTITNNDQPAHLIVIKHVINDSGGIKAAADFTMTINDVAVPTGASFPGAESPGTDKLVHPGTYTVTETPVIGYAASFSAECSGTINLGETKTCTVTNDDILPVIALDKTGPATVNAGDNIAYTLAWSVSAAPVTNAVITDTVPTNTTFVSAGCGTTTGTCVIDTSTGTISWNLGNRTIGESGTVTLTVQANAPLLSGTVITNTGIFDTTETDPVSDTVTTTIASLPVLGLQKSVTPTTVPAGQNASWTVTWSVAGNSVATNVTIVDPVPANTTFVSVADGGVYDATTNTITWNLGTQSPGASGEVHFVVKTASPIANNTVITNTATIDSAETDPPISASASVTVTSAPLLSITKVHDVSAFTNPGKAMTYTVKITNSASATDTAKNVVLTDTLPAGFTFAVDGTTTKTFTIGDLAPGQSATVTYLVNISGTKAAGTYDNLAKAKGDNTNEVSAIAPVEVRVPQVLGVETNPDLTIVKTVNKKTAKPGDVVMYTITVKNAGDGDANNVVVSDTLPKDLSFVNGKGRTMTWEIGTLKPGHSRVINVDVRVESDAQNGTYENVAVLTSDEVPQKEARAQLEVRKPKVLGLATTGAGPLDYAIAMLGATLIMLGVLGLRRPQREGAH